MANLLEVFKQKYEALKGQVHIVGGWDGAAEQAASILSGESITRVALAPLADAFAKGLIARLESAGIEVMAPPYPAADLPGALDSAQAGISAASFAIAETGTLVEVTDDDAHRLVSALPRTHIGVVTAGTLVRRLADAAPRLRAIFEDHTGDCVVSFISGPSRTGDIEMILTLGVHGPEVAHAIVVENADD